MSEVLLNCFPSFNIGTPNPALSVLKSYLSSNNVDVSIKYWNLEFDNIYRKYLDYENASEVILLSPFIVLLNPSDEDLIIKNTTQLYVYRKNKGLSLYQFKNAFAELVKEIENHITKEIDSLIDPNTKIFGISYKYNQWIPSIVVSRYFKKTFPLCKIVIGGFDDKNVAEVILKQYDCFDYAIWGEGEFPLLKLYNDTVNNSIDVKAIDQLVFRENGMVFKNRRSDVRAFNNYTVPEYKDYIEQLKSLKIKPKLVEIPINAVRGCSWNKCKFCISKNGALYQERDPSLVAKEIQQLFLKYSVTNFIFVDNCSFKNNEDLMNLCDQLITLNGATDKYIRLGITINHSGVTKELIDKLFLAGIHRIQVGFESFSENYLSLMGKENSLSDNILFIKLVLRYNIVLPLLILSDMPNESVNDIVESIENLHFFRFYLSNKNFNIGYSPLRINQGSIFYKNLPDEQIDKFNFNETAYLLGESIKKIDFNKSLFSYRKDQQNNIEWNNFYSSVSYYEKNVFSYKLIRCNSFLYYYEYLNGIEIDTIIFDDELYYEILKITEVSIHSLESLINKLNKNVNRDNIISILNDLKSVYLIYFNKDMSEIVSIISTNEICIN